MSNLTQTEAAVTPADFLDHWQGHRRLTRRVIEAFPEDQLFTFNMAGMRPFGAMAWEAYGVAAYSLHALVTDDWKNTLWQTPRSESKADLLAAWDDLTRQMDGQLPGVPPARYHEAKTLVWGPGSMPAWVAVIYAIDNEIHHRGQGYMYLRTLGTEPPAFYER